MDNWAPVRRPRRLGAPFLLLAALALPAYGAPPRTVLLRTERNAGTDRLLRGAAAEGAFGLLNVAQPARLAGVRTEASALATALAQRLPEAQRGEIRLVIAADRPPPGRLGAAAMIGPGIPKGSLLTSPTTRTRGLIAAIDLTDEGRPPAFLPSRAPLAEVETLDRRVTATEAAKGWTLGLYGAFAGLAVLLSVAAIAAGRGAGLARALLLIAAAGPIALLLVGLFAATPAALYAALFALLSLLLALGIALFRRRRPERWTRTAVGLTGILLLIDGLRGAPLVANSPLSAYYLAGIRYYGIGNEYMGFLLGSLLMTAPPRWMPGTGLLATAVLGLPMLGADAGGAMASTVAFARACLPPRRWRAPAALLAAVAVAALLALLDRALPAAAQSHIGQAAGKGPQTWLEIARRKLAMSVRIALTPGALIAVAGLAPTWIALSRGRIGGRVRRALAQETEFPTRLAAAAWGAAAALALNDSGLVAALLLLAPVTATVVESALCATSPSITEPDGSA